MSKFNEQYIKLMQVQVFEEIDYLMKNGHGSEKIYEPCVFCIKHPTNDYFLCRRLKDLREFQSKLALNAVQNKYQDKRAEKSRRVIGQGVTNLGDENSIFHQKYDSHATMPLLNQFK